MLSHLSGSGGDARYARVAFSPDGAMLATASRSGTVRFWGRGMEKEFARLETGSALPRLAFSADGRMLAVCGLCDPEVRLWRVRDVLAALPHGGS